jgi:hypothetical protein
VERKNWDILNFLMSRWEGAGSRFVTGDAETHRGSARKESGN